MEMINMPHDRNGKYLTVGDNVNIPCTIKSITTDENYCNLTLVAKYPMPPYEFDHIITLNAKQVILAEPSKVGEAT